MTPARDGTGSIAAAIADPRLAIVQGEPRPAGWSGKLWAVAQGLVEAGDADLVLLTDADIVHDPRHLANLLQPYRYRVLLLTIDAIVRRLNDDPAIPLPPRGWSGTWTPGGALRPADQPPVPRGLEVRRDAVRSGSRRRTTPGRCRARSHCGRRRSRGCGSCPTTCGTRRRGGWSREPSGRRSKAADGDRGSPGPGCSMGCSICPAPTGRLSVRGTTGPT